LDLRNEDLTKEIIDDLKNTADVISCSFKEAIDEIEHFWREETCLEDHDSRTLFGHERALDAIKSGLAITAKIQESFAGLEKHDAAENFSRYRKIFQSIEQGLEQAAKNMRGMLLPAANYLESILDHELVSALVYSRAREPARIVTSASDLPLRFSSMGI